MALIGTIRPGNDLGFRNRIHNGEFAIWQRGTTITGVGVDGRSVDRWFQWANAGGQAGRTTWSRETSDLPTGFTTGLKIQVTTTETPSALEAYAINTRLEGIDFQDLAWGTASAKPLTFSFWAKTNKPGTYCVYLNASNASTKYNIREVSLTNTWTLHTVTFSGDTSQSIINDTVGRIAVYIGLMAGSSTTSGTAGDSWNTGYGFTTNQINFFDSTDNIIRITGAQLEVGSVATSFEHRPLSIELMLCYRYFLYDGFFDRGNSISTTSGGRYYETWELPVPMRASPTLTWTRTGARSADGFSVFPNGDSTETTSVGTKFARQMENNPFRVIAQFYGTGASLLGTIHYYYQDSTAYASAEI